MEKCSGCGEQYFAGVIAPGQVCFACTTQKIMQTQEKKQAEAAVNQPESNVYCTIDLENKEVNVWKNGKLIILITDDGTERIVRQPNDLVLRRNDLAIIEDNFNAMQEMLKESLTSKE